MKTTEWHSSPTFGGDALTSRYTGKKIAASDLCVAIIRTCPRCYSKFTATPAQPYHCDPVCEHGTALDVHCCNCHSGFIFDPDHECEPDAVGAPYIWANN